MSLRATQIALAISVVLNVLLCTGIWYYQSIEGVLSMVEMAVGFVD